MTQTLFKVGDNDYSAYVIDEGVACSKVEVGLVKRAALNGLTYKNRAALKDSVTVAMAMVPDAVFTQLCEDVAGITFTATYRGQSGENTAECYTDTGVVGTLLTEINGASWWGTVQIDFFER